MTITRFAPAKINLSLLVGAPLSNGRHPLDSLVAFTRSCGDHLTFEPSLTPALTIRGPFGAALEVGEDNLVSRAAKLMQPHTGLNFHASIQLDKRLPIASGIGGGSADAAATLLGLNDLWALGLGLAQLETMGASLGADVPACVRGSPLRMTGTGEQTQLVGALPRLGIVLVNPMVPCPTGPVYKRYDEIGAFTQIADGELGDLSSTDQLLAFLRKNPNDLETAAIDLVPEIGMILEALKQTPNVLLARMSGSGATCFGLYADIVSAQMAQHKIKKDLANRAIWVEADEIN